MTKKEEKAAKKAERKAAKKKVKEKGTGTWAEFKKFISKGNIVDLAIGVIMASAFSAIVTALTNILLSLATWGVPGGLSGLVTVLSPLNDSQAGVNGVQFFDASSIVWAMAETGLDESGIAAQYTLYGGTYVYNGAAVIDWGTFINAIISFLVIAITLFAFVKIVAYVKTVNKQIQDDALERYYEKHPEERPAPAEKEAPKPTEVELLVQIRDLLLKEKSIGEKVAAEKAEAEAKKKAEEAAKAEEAVKETPAEEKAEA